MTKKKKNNNHDEYEVIEEIIEEEEIEEEEEIKPKKKNKRVKIETVEKKENGFKQFINNPLPIMIIQTIWIIVMIIAYVNLKSSIHMFVGKVEEDVVAISNIHYFINNDMNYFHASSATFIGEDKEVYSYNVGYYIEDANGELVEFISRSNKLEAPVSLKAAVQDMSAWSFGEAASQRKFFTPDVIKRLDNLHFVISASTEKGSDKADVYYDFKVNTTRITK